MRAEEVTASAAWSKDAHAAWWAAFWQRSYINLGGSSTAAVVSRGYCLERYLQACGGRGEQPLKFNGNLFTVEGRGFDADFRQWGGMYWLQNTRLPYWGMLSSGDLDLMGPLLRTYADALPVHEARALAWWGHAGAAVPEIMHWWGGLGDEVRRDGGVAAGRAMVAGGWQACGCGVGGRRGWGWTGCEGEA